MNCITNRTIYENKVTHINGIELEELREKYSYDSETGIIRNKHGKVISATDWQGYIKVRPRNAEGKYAQIYGHRLAWLFHYGSITPNKHIDHIDGDGSNNRIENLRLVNPRENTRNQKLSRRNKTGQIGVSLVGDKYVVQIASKYLGRYDSFEHACIVAQEMYRIHGFHENHGRQI